jgi:hypothetical protein
LFDKFLKYLTLNYDDLPVVSSGVWQILNQPLAPQTLILLNQLLQHIKVLHNLMQQQQMIQNINPLAKPNSNQAMLHNAVQITKTKQQITNLQVNTSSSPFENGFI